MREFRHRCARAGLAAWAVDEGGASAISDAGGRVMAGRDALIVSQALEAALAEASAGKAWVRRDVGPHARILVAPHMARRTVIGRTAVLLGDVAGVEAIDAAGSLPLSAAAQHVDALDAMLRWMLDDLAQREQDRMTIEGFTRELSLVYEYIRLLYTLARSMKTGSSPADFVALCCEEIREITGYTWVCAQFADCEDVVEPLRGVAMCAGEPGCDRGEFVRAAGETIASLSSPSSFLIRAGESGAGRIIARDAACHPIVRDDVIIGAVIAANDDPGYGGVSSVETQLFDVAADLLGVFLDNAGLYVDQRSLFFGSLRAMTAAIDAKDRYTCGHSERVAHLASRLAGAIGQDAEQVERVHIAGLLHDVGKIGVPESVLTFPGRLSDEQFAFIKQHPEIGHGILKDIRELEDVRPGVLTHHERWDGRGYPRGLAGEDIPLLGRLLALADTFDAMSSSRSYRPAMPREKVLAEIARCAGTQFDPALAVTFLQLDFSEFDAMVARHAGEYASQMPLAKSA